MRESQAQSYDEISTTRDLGYFLVAQGLNLVWSRPGDGVFLAKLARIIGSTGVDFAGACKDCHEARAAKLKVNHFKFVHTLHSVRRVELTERACAPKIKLLILGETG